MEVQTRVQNSDCHAKVAEPYPASCNRHRAVVILVLDLKSILHYRHHRRSQSG